MRLREELGQLLDKYMKADGGVEQPAAVRDLLTDLRHYCDENGVDFDYASDGSEDVYEEELDDDDL